MLAYFEHVTLNSGTQVWRRRVNVRASRFLNMSLTTQFYLFEVNYAMFLQKNLTERFMLW